MSSATQILWIGAGSGEGFQPAPDYKRIIAVEARGEACQQLTKLQHQIPQLEVVEALISTQDGSELFYRYNIAALSANQKGSGLKALFPGLKLVSEELLPAKSLTNLIKELKLDSASCCALWLDTPATAFPLLKHLAEQKLLRSFTELKLSWPTEALYDNYEAQAEVLAWLQAQFFDLVETNLTDPDLPVFSFQLNKFRHDLQHHKNKLKQATNELAELKAALEKANQQNEVLQQQTEQVKTELSSKAQQEAAAKAELQKQLEALKQQQTAQQQQSEQLKIELTSKVQQETAAKVELQKQLDVLKQQQTAQQQQSEQLKTELTSKVQQEIAAKAELQKQLDFLKQQKVELQKIADGNEVLLHQEKKDHAACKEKLAETQTWFANRKKQAEETLVMLEAAKQEIEVLKAKQNATEMMAELQKNMHDLFASQSKQLQQATNALGQHITKTQIEQLSNVQNFFGLQQFLQHGEPLLQLSPWSIQTDTLNQIIKLLNSNNYDAIIEFGSGESTVVLAKTLFNQSLFINQVSDDTKPQISNRVKSSELQTKHVANDLPSRIISFEQSESFYKQTELTLNQHGLAHLVDLVFSPLVPSSCAHLAGEEKSPLFYDCIDKLGQLKQLLPGKKAKILVIVDGPTSPTESALARYAALPSVLHHFSASKLHFVLDDAKRINEKQVLDLWQMLCKERGLQFTTVDWQTNKGAVLLEINP